MRNAFLKSIQKVSLNRRLYKQYRSNQLYQKNDLLIKYQYFTTNKINTISIDDNKSRNNNINNTTNNINKLYNTNLRNLGIIAHIDAGKTTTTERMLFFSGWLKRMGEVHTGDTAMDYLAEERARGITIQAAAITFPWREHQLNLIDTPGHVDFTLEVERSVRVLDGAITILDAVGGVEAQTETVWAQANRYQVPRIVFINKLDRPGADMTTCITQLETKLGANALLCQLPIWEQDKGDSNHGLVGLIDLVNWCQLKFGYDESRAWEPKPTLQESNLDLLKVTQPKLFAEAVKRREQLIDRVAELDEMFLEHFIEIEDPNQITNDVLRQAIRRVCLAQRGVPVLCGSSLKNIGVQPLLDAVVDYLPAPEERPLPLATTQTGQQQPVVFGKRENLCALAFKVVYDPLRGPMTYVRLYAGTLTAGSTLYNSSRPGKERITKLFRVNADEFEPITQLESGDIGLALGFKHTRTGDTLVSSKPKLDSQRIQLPSLPIPKPVFLCAIEPLSSGDEPELLKALDNLVLEDPSLQVTHDPESGQILLGGMGELHLEIVRNRLLNDLKVKAEMGSVFIAYRDTLTQQIDQNFVYEGEVLGTRIRYTFQIHITPLELETSPEDTQLMDGNLIDVDPSLTFEGDFSEVEVLTSSQIRNSLQEGILAALSRGGSDGYSMTQLYVRVNQIIAYQPIQSNHLIQAIYQTIHQLLQKYPSSFQRLEPQMRVQIQVPTHHMGSVLADLSGSSKARILGFDEGMNTGDEALIEKHKVEALVPLSSMLGYSSKLRSITQGTASLSMCLEGYGPVN